jgi:archaeal chaperonin
MSENNTTQRLNIEAVKRIAETVRTTLGPLGMDKMMVDGGGNVIVTNDGATILREVDTAHPAAKMVVEVSKMQETNAYDGTTSTVVLASQLLSNSENLFAKGLHPNVINKGYAAARNMAIECLEGMEDADGDLLSLAKTAITGKSLETSEEKVAQLCVETIEAVGDAREVKTLAAPGGALSDSYLFRGVVLNKDFIGGGDEFNNWADEEGAEILLINGGLTETKGNENVSVQVQDANSYSQVQAMGRDKLLASAKAVVSSGAKVVVCRDGVHDTAISYLRKQGISVVQRVPESTMRRLANEVGAPIHMFPDATSTTGVAFISRNTYNDIPYLFMYCKKKEATLVLLGATQSTLDEIQRGFDDALGVVSLVKNGDSVRFGGGATYLAIAAHLRANASEIGGRAQMAIEAFADALEIIPATIAENAGYDPLDTVLAMRHALPEPYGPDVENGGIKLMAEVYEPTSLIRSAISGATEVANAILRIDDVIGRRGAE